MAVFIKRVIGNFGRDHVPNTVRGSGYSSPRSGASIVDLDSFVSILRPLVSPIIGPAPSAAHSLASAIISPTGKVKKPRNNFRLGDLSSGSRLKDLFSGLFSPSNLSGSGSGSGFYSSGSSAIPASAPDYLNADLARHYGMDASTAYMEALANTSHQREVKDLVAAGLNPVLSTRYGGSSGVSGASVYAPAEPAVSGVSSAKSSSVLADLASGVVGLATGSSAKSNATRSIVNALGNIVENLSQSRE